MGPDKDLWVRFLTEHILQIVARVYQRRRCPVKHDAGTALRLATFLHPNVLGQLSVPASFLELAEEDITWGTGLLHILYVGLLMVVRRRDPVHGQAGDQQHRSQDPLKQGQCPC